MTVTKKGNAPAGVKNELWMDALRLVATTNNASISLFQNRLRISYMSAFRILENMEKMSLVSPFDDAGRSRVIFIEEVNACLDTTVTY